MSYLDLTECRGCGHRILAGTHGGVCGGCWNRVVDGELTLHMGPETKEENAERFIARIPVRRAIDRILAAQEAR
jgi:hypothetical protein